MHKRSTGSRSSREDLLLFFVFYLVNLISSVLVLLAKQSNQCDKKIINIELKHEACHHHWLRWLCADQERRSCGFLHDMHF